MKSALVIGATGFIGGHVAKEALTRGWNVYGLRRRVETTGLLQDSGIQWKEGDIDRPESLVGVLEGVDIVFHAAGYVPHRGRSVPIHMTKAIRQIRNVLLAVKEAQVERLIYTSSLSTIGHPPPGGGRLADERDHYVPGMAFQSAYYECKYAMESEVLRAGVAGVPLVVVNPTAVFGPGDARLSLGMILIYAAKGWMKAWIDVETNVVDVRDVAAAQVDAVERGRLGERYILGGHNIHVKDLIELVAQLTQRSPPRFRIPLWLIDVGLRSSSWIPQMLPLRNHLAALPLWQGYNCQKAQRELGLSPRPIETTLRDALAWYVEHKYLQGIPSVV
jgi:dihydroflavonol-4-reductase